MPTLAPVVLIVGRERDLMQTLIEQLREANIDVEVAVEREAAFRILDRRHVEGLVTTLDPAGLAILRRARERNPELCAVIVSSAANPDGVADALSAGAHEVQIGLQDQGRTLAVLQRGLAHQRLLARAALLEEKFAHHFAPERLAGHSRAITRVLEHARHIAPSQAAVLIEGETGTGKELLAHAIHRLGPRSGGRFLWFDCEAIPGDLIAPALFGIDAFPSGEFRPKPGFVELARGGTLFLDEVAALPLTAQLQLVRLLQDREFERIGGTDTLTADVRVIASTRRDLAAEVRAGRVREDLEFRLGAVRIQMPALRDRLEDIPLLVDVFRREFNRAHGRRVTGVTPGALERLMGHLWPGNVRELLHVVEGMVVFAEGRRPLDLSDLPPPLRGDEPLRIAVGMTVGEAERLLIAATLEHAGHDRVRAAAMLGIGLRTLYRKIKQYGLRQ